MPIKLICFGPVGAITHAVCLTLLPIQSEVRGGYTIKYNFFTNNLHIKSRSPK